MLHLVFIIVFKSYVFCEPSPRIPIYRMLMSSSNKTNCTITKENVTICETSSRHFGRILTKAASVYESLVNIADTYFVGRISIGTPAQLFIIDFDTGSSDLWVASTQCSLNCDKFNKYDAKSSSTYIANGKNFSIEYGDGSSAAGFFSIDTVIVNGIRVDNQIFAECTSIIGMNDFQSDGILGLAYPGLTLGTEIPFFYNMWYRGLISKPLFSFYLNPDTSSLDGGELIFGDVDSSKYIDPITYVPVVIPRYWEFRMDGIYVNTTAINTSLYAIIDTTSTFIIGPAASIDVLNIALGGIYDSLVGMYKVDCKIRSLSSFPNVTFIIGGQAFTLTPLQYILIFTDEDNSYVCYTVFVPSNVNDSHGNLIWILGNFFLYRFYSIFDIKSNRVGLAISTSYNWTQPINSSLFNISSTTTQITIATINMTTTGSMTSTLSNSAHITTVTSIAIKMEIFLKNVANNFVLLLILFLIKTV
ncbi:unnamed protein product [Rotaria sp. Silwood1]|nr:unnamed protein product [Rotaria sp. Silwood1]CAF4691035.1 unnamed protein product [Rotaria sp. Silwood1]